MSRIEKIEHGNFADNKIQYKFQCPGCKRSHTINDKWDFNGDFEYPTIKPSVLFKGGRFDKNENWIDLRCHSFVTDGKIRFLNDCSHNLAGKTVNLPELGK